MPMTNPHLAVAAVLGMQAALFFGLARTPSPGRSGDRRRGGRGRGQDIGVAAEGPGARWLRKNVRPGGGLVCVRNSIWWDAYRNLAA
jgi:hypothetical protein